MKMARFDEIEVGGYFVHARHLHKKVDEKNAIDYEWHNGYVWRMYPHTRVRDVRSAEVYEELTNAQKEFLDGKEVTREEGMEEAEM